MELAAKFMQDALSQFPPECPVQAKELSLTVLASDGHSNSKIQLFTVEAGHRENPMIVLIHGFPDNWYCWKNLIPGLVKAGYFVVAPNLRGYAYSSKPKSRKDYGMNSLVGDLVGLLDVYGEKKAIFIGHDWGGVILWRLTMDYPERVMKPIFLCAPHPYGLVRQWKKSWKQRLMSWYVLFFQLPWLPEIRLTRNVHRKVKAIMGKTVREKAHLTPFEINFYGAMWTQDRAMKTMIHYYRALFCPRAKSFQYKMIGQPALVIMAENDMALTPEINEGLEQDWVPKMQRVTVPHCSHWIQREAPEEILEHILHFIGQGVVVP